MILTALLNLVSALVGVLLLPLKILNLSSDILNLAQTGIAYIINGFSIVASYTHFGFLMSLFSIVLVIDAMYHAYLLIMWILRKIPFLGIN